MNPLRACAAITLAVSSAHAGAPIEWVFDASLPAGVTFERSSPRLDESGNTVPANTPVFSPRAVTLNGAAIITALNQSHQILAAQQLTNGLTATLAIEDGAVYLTYDTPGLSALIAKVEPHPSNATKFGGDHVWGLPSGGEIFVDGTVLIFANGAAPNRQAVIIRTSLTTFQLDSGMTLVRTSEYIPPRGGGTTQSPPWFTRKTSLPNLNKTVSTIAEYQAQGLASTAYPGDGRSLGFGSTDNGLTWQRLFDTDNILLGRDHIIDAKHLHHVEPFEWWDETEQRWNIGAIGCLGDGPTAAGPILAFSHTQDFDDPDAGQYPILERRKDIGRDMLTDIFPLNQSLAPGSPLRYLLGPDTAQAGIVEVTIDEIDQTDRFLFRPATTFVRRTDLLNALCIWPFIFQLNRLPNGCIVAPTEEATGGFNPNGIWASDTTGEHWTTVHQAYHTGYTGVIPVSSNRFWTFNRSGNQTNSELWILDPPTVQQSLLFAPAATDLATGNFFFNAVDLIRTDATGTLDPPSQVPTDTQIWRMQSTTIPAGTRFDDNALYSINAQQDQLVSLVTWVKPARNDVSTADFRFNHQFKLADDSLLTIPTDTVGLHSNDWTRLVSTRRVPEDAIQGVRFQCLTTEDASATKPFDYYFTQPQVIISDQPIVQSTPAGSTVAEDRLSLALPQLGPEWTIEIDLTEELALAFSLIDDNSRNLTVENQSESSTPWQGLSSVLRLSPNFTSQPTFPIHSLVNDVFMPTQTRLTIVMSQPDNTLKMYVNRGMGDTDGVAVLTESFTPITLQMGTPDWSHVFQGALHRIRVWPDTALDLGPAPLFVRCPQDANEDDTVDVNDISYVLFRLGNTGDPKTLEGDVNFDGVVDVNDISGVLFNLGPCPTP